MRTIEFRWICLIFMIFPIEDGVMKLISSEGNTINALLMIAASTVYLIVISRDISGQD